MPVIIIGNSKPLPPVDRANEEERIQGRNALQNANRALRMGPIPQHQEAQQLEKPRAQAAPVNRMIDASPVVPAASVVLDHPDNVSIKKKSKPMMLSRVSSTHETPAKSGHKPLVSSEASTGSVARGIRTPTDFMAQWRAKNAERIAIAESKPVSRRIVFKNVPDWANLTDVLCLVYGGPIERIWSEQENEVIVQFFKVPDCEEYYDDNSSGIFVDGQVIEVEQAECPPLSKETKHWITAGCTRVVKVDIHNDKTFQDLQDIVKDLELDHLMYRAEPNTPGSVYFFFCSLESSYDLMTKLLGRGWLHCPAQFFPDPCAVAKDFHANSIPVSRMADASTAEPPVSKCPSSEVLESVER
ncbi:hypothetical protein N7492_003119 [Penicillium capsulatum]|uniref:Uncharacterized protein n=1 Tax=Penicillium capsulatum TaxID=69766 RepID=A0A9W9IJ01_9EURO|nr:hypothetical protein N7492_003119 [Penicillium capsulatum]KAJ6122291.1 hypothetical protein N7512_004756 [Penicillium capsulatum]